jgi:anaerobic ribonucleoside-triphosphate reductase activating protein
MGIHFPSMVNGPGRRFVVWVQGCKHGCRGCFNPGSWQDGERDLVRPADLVERIVDSGCDGVTVTGGEPMGQPRGLLELLLGLHPGGQLLPQLSQGLICFTGHEVSELLSDPEAAACVPYFDLLVSGRFVEALRAPSGLVGSTNQQLLFSGLPGRGEQLVPRSSVHGSPSGVELFESAGELRVTGFPSLDAGTLRRLGLRVISEKIERE